MAETVFWGATAFVGFALTVRFLTKTFKTLREQRLIENTPTVKAKSVFIGTVELRGTATLENARPLTASISGLPCVYVRNELEKSNGVEWKTVSRPAKRLAYWYLRDETGSVRVVTRDAEIRPRFLGERYLTPVQRVREYGIPLGSEVYVFGKARIQADAVAPEIAADATQFLLISTDDAESVVEEKAEETTTHSMAGMLGSLILGASVVFLTIPSLAANSFLLGVFCGASLGISFYCLAFKAVFAVSVANSLSDLSWRVCQAKSNADIELTRRSDLFLALTSAAQGWTRQERAVEEALATLRLQAEIERPTVSFDGGARPWTPTLRELVEDAPELEANKAFAYLQKNVADAEERVAASRSYYNAVAKLYEARRRAWAILAFLLRFEEARFFKTSVFAASSNKVKR